MLMTPGPTAVPEFVRKAMADETLHHRTPEFEKIFADTRVLLKEIMNMPEVVMLASSGTGAMESCVTNLTNKKALTINSGKFGERFSKICEAFDIPYSELKNEWDSAVSVDEVVDAIKNDTSIDAIFIQICESAGGLRHPVEQIAKEVKSINPNIMIVADGITAVGVEKIDTTNLDALITGSQKALMLPPALAMIGLSQKAVEKINQNSKGYYFNLASEIKKQQNNTTAYTAATTLIIGLKEILSYIKQNGGYEKLYADTKNIAYATREALKAIDCKIYPKTPADAMTTIYTEDAPKIRKILKQKYDVNIAGGQDHIKSLIYRINHMGLVKPYEAAWVINSIELAMDELGIREFDGTANAVFLKSIYKAK